MFLLDHVSVVAHLGCAVDLFICPAGIRTTAATRKFASNDRSDSRNQRRPLDRHDLRNLGMAAVD